MQTEPHRRAFARAVEAGDARSVIEIARAVLGYELSGDDLDALLRLTERSGATYEASRRLRPYLVTVLKNHGRSVAEREHTRDWIAERLEQAGAMWDRPEEVALARALSTEVVHVAQWALTRTERKVFCEWWGVQWQAVLSEERPPTNTELAVCVGESVGNFAKRLSSARLKMARAMRQHWKGFDGQAR